jgi:DNA-binding MarR family transcriptional regulator
MHYNWGFKMFPNLSLLEVWVLARALAGYQLSARRDQLSPDVLELVRYISAIPWKDREMTLRIKLSPEDFAKVIGMDAESPAPGTTPKPSNEPEFVFYSLDELLRLPKLEWLIPGLLPSRGLCMVYGASGVGKSFWALDLAYKLAFQDSVVYIVAEGEAGMSERVLALMRHKGIVPDKITFVLGVVNLFDGNELETFSRLANAHNPKLIVVDTLAMCTGTADENSARDMKVIIDSCKRITRQLNTSVMLVHHTNKEGRQARGSGRLFNDCDTVIRLTRMDDVIQVESQKTKDRAKFKTYYLREVNVPLGYKDDQGQDVASLVLMPAEKVIPGAGLTDSQFKVLEAISVEPNASLAELAATTEMQRGVVQNIIKRLTNGGYLSAFNGESRALTEIGKKALSDSNDESVISLTDSTDSTDSIKLQKPILQNEGVTGVTRSQESPRPRNRRLFNDPLPAHTNYDDGA